MSFSEIDTNHELEEIIGVLAEHTSCPIKNLEDFSLERLPFGNNLARPQDFMKQTIFN